MPRPGTADAATTAVVVVHGVGNPQPGETLGRLSATLSHVSDEFRLCGPVQSWDALDHDKTQGDLYAFSPVPWQRAQLGDEALVMAEVYWGTQGALPSGVAGLLRGLFQLIFGMSGLIEWQPEKVSPIERRVIAWGTLGSLILRGPVFAINTALLMALGVFLGPHLYRRISQWSEASVAGGGLFDCAAVSFLGVSVQRAVWIGSCLGLLLSAGVLWRWYAQRARQPSLGFDAQWFYGVSLLVFCLAWPVIVSAMGYQTLQPVALVAFGFLFAAFAVVMMAVLMVINFYGVTALWRSRFDQRQRRSISARAMALAIQFVLWSILVPSIWLVLLWLMPEVNGDHQCWLDSFRAVVPSDGLQWFFLLLPAVSALAVVIYRKSLWRSQTKTRPRLIVHFLIRESLLWSVAAVAIAIAAVSVLNALSLWQEGAPLAIPGFIQWFRDIEVDLIPFIPVLVASTVLVRNAVVSLDIGNDVVKYVGEAMPSASRPRSAQDPLEQQRPIRHKFNQVIRLLQRHHHLKRIIVVSHSQGTVLAIDELAQSDFGQADDWLEKLELTLITMGSPFSHLYQHYFPLAYPALNDPVWSRLRRRLNRWINIYRVDDFVGTAIGQENDRSDEFELVQHPMGKGGHVSYLYDAKVVMIIAQALGPEIPGTEVHS